MFLILKRDWEAVDATTGQRVKTSISAGKHEIELVKNPLGFDAPWLVLKGTLIGASEVSWRQWSGPEWDEWQVVIED